MATQAGWYYVNRKHEAERSKWREISSQHSVSHHTVSAVFIYGVKEHGTATTAGVSYTQHNLRELQ